VKNYNKIARQAGMTLIELTVVLLVLIGLAGLMIPYVSGFVSKTHDSTGADSLASLNSAIQRYDVQFLGQPNNYDSLMTSLAVGTPGTIYAKMMGGTAGATDYLKTVEIQGASLAHAGINSLRTMNDSSADATFAATNATATIVNGSGLYTVAAINVNGSCGMGAEMGCIATDADLAFILGRSASTINTTNNDYIVFGVGSDSGMVGKTISEAPVHFAKTGAMSAANKYNRILAVYSVPKTGVNCLLTAGGPATGATEYWDTAAAGAEVTAITDLASCTAANGEALVDNTVPATPVIGTAVTASSWNSTGMAVDVSYVTTAMPMMKLEGLTGALASHYSSMDN